MTGDETGEVSRRLGTKVWAPWGEYAVESLRDYQASGAFHEYTCGTDSSHGPLTPTENGWICEGDEDCAYHQLWAHLWTADRTWETMRFPKDPPEEKRGANFGFRLVACTKLKVTSVDKEKRLITGTDLVSVTLGCTTAHRGKVPKVGDTIYFHGPVTEVFAAE